MTQTLLAWFREDPRRLTWVLGVLGTGLVLFLTSVANALSKHYTEHVGWRRFVLFVLEVLSFLRSRDDRGTIKAPFTVRPIERENVVALDPAGIPKIVPPGTYAAAPPPIPKEKS